MMLLNLMKIMKKLDVTIEVLETKELATVSTEPGSCGTVSGGSGDDTVVYACCCCCCC